MRLPVIEGLIRRRILINFRVDPRVLEKLLPPPFQPKLVRGFAVAGICLIRLEQIRPFGLPQWAGVSSENCAVRVAAQWPDGGSLREGVFIFQRYSSGRFNTMFGGRLFPGVHRQAHFDVREEEGRVHLAISGAQMKLDLEAAATLTLPADSVFRSLEEASAFFRAGSLGYSPARQAGIYEGMELRSVDWNMQPLDVPTIRSSFFADEAAFPRGSAVLDSAFLMRNIAHQWHDAGKLR